MDRLAAVSGLFSCLLGFLQQSATCSFLEEALAGGVPGFCGLLSILRSALFEWLQFCTELKRSFLSKLISTHPPPASLALVLSLGFTEASPRANTWMR